MYTPKQIADEFKKSAEAKHIQDLRAAIAFMSEAVKACHQPDIALFVTIDNTRPPLKTENDYTDYISGKFNVGETEYPFILQKYAGHNTTAPYRMGFTMEGRRQIIYLTPNGMMPLQRALINAIEEERALAPLREAERVKTNMLTSKSNATIFPPQFNIPKP